MIQHSDNALPVDYINIRTELPADGGDLQHWVEWSDTTALVMLLGMLDLARDTIIRNSMEGDA